MKRWYIIGLSLLLSGLLSSAPPSFSPPSGTPPGEKPKKGFSFEKKPLLAVLEKVIPPGTQVILPQRAADLDALKNQQVTYLPSQSRKDAWSLIKTYLELSGYSMAQRDNQFIIVNQKSIKGGAVNREVLPVFAGTLEDSPTDDTQIRYIHYLRNLKVPDLSEKDKHPLSNMLQTFLSDNGSLVFDTKSNAIIMTDKASHLHAIAKLLHEFDTRGIKEEVAYLPIRNLPAQEVVKVFDQLKLASGIGDAKGRKFISNNEDAKPFFTQDTTIIADPVRNGIVLMGRKNHVERVSDFIANLIDVPPESGESILHYYNLEYLNNVDVAPLLTRLVASALPNTQATQEAEHTFKGVVIAAEEATIRKPSVETEPIVIEQKGFEGEVVNLEEVATNAGNRLIIAARKDDWHIIKKLLKKIDTPQPQVLLEILIAEFSYEHDTDLAGTLRSKTDAPLLPEGIQYLASHITPVNTVLGNTPTQLAEDLLQVIGGESVAAQTPQGSLLMSLNDPKTPGIFGLLQVLDTVLSTKIRAYPYLTIMNNREGTIDSTETRQNVGELIQGVDGSFIIPVDEVPATINVTAIPHIISEDKLRLNIGFTIDEFQGETFTRATRELKTTATLRSGQILAMGGIMRIDTQDFKTKTPILGDIPLFGIFFRRTNNETVRRNLTLFVMPTILNPYSRWTEKTKELICENQEAGLRQVFDDREPIVRLFFNQSTRDNRQGLDDFIAEGINLHDFKTCDEPKLLQLTKPKPREHKPIDALHEILAMGGRPSCLKIDPS